MALLSHRQGWTCAVAITLFPCVFFASSTSDLTATYRTGTSEVRISFFATDEKNELVPSVTRDDFAIVDNGDVVREFRSLNPSNETSIDVLLLLDSSGSVEPRFQTIRGGILRLAAAPRKSPDIGLSLIAFGASEPGLLCTNGCTVLVLSPVLAAIRPSGITPLFDAIEYAVRFMAERRKPDVRQVIILFSDGNDTASRATPRDAVDSLIASGIVMYTINTGAANQIPNGNAFLESIAEVTGGRSFWLRDEIDTTLHSILADLQASYIVTYSLPSRFAGFHSLRILPKHNSKLRFHCRRGYVYDGNH